MAEPRPPIDVDDHFTDTAGNHYHIHMTDHTQGDLDNVLDELCRFIDQTAINGPGIEFTGWFELMPGNFMYWVNREDPLFLFLDAESQVQHPDNFLAFTRVGNQITITHFGPFGWNKKKDLDEVKKARKKAEDLNKEAEKERKRLEKERMAREKGDPNLSDKEPKVPPLMPAWIRTKNDEAIAEMAKKMMKKVASLAATRKALETAVKAGKDIAETITKATAKAGVEAGAEAVPGLGFLAGLVFGTWRLAHGDFAGAGWEIASGTVSLVPGPGTAASMGIDAALLGKDILETQKKVNEEEAKQKALYNEELKEWKADNDTMIRLLGEKIKEYKDAEDGCNHCIQGCDQLIRLGVKAGAGEGAKE